MTKFAPAALILIALPLAGCIKFGAEPPASLLSLKPAASVPVGQTQSASGSTIQITVPTVPQEIATLRVPVQATDTSVAYIKDAQWVEPVNRQFARVLSDTIAARTGRVVADARFLGDASTTLSGELRTFGIDAASQSAVVTYDAALLRRADAPLEKRRFEARVPVAAVDAPSAGVALNQAANEVAQQVSDWVGR